MSSYSDDQTRELFLTFAGEFRQALSQQGAQILFRLSTDLKILSVSPRFKSLYYFPHALLKMRLDSFDSHKDSQLFARMLGHIRECLEKGIPITEEFLLFGSLPTRINITPTYTMLNVQEGVMVILENIQQEHTRQIELNETNSRMRFVTKALKMTIWEIDFRIGSMWFDENFFPVIGIGDTERSPIPIPTREQILERVHPDDRLKVAKHIDEVRTLSEEKTPPFVFRSFDENLNQWATIRNEATITERDAQGLPMRLLGYSQRTD